MKEDQPSQAALGTLYMAIFLDKFGALMIQPILPFLAIGMNASAFQLGMLTSVYSLAEMLGTICLGILSDKVGRRKVLLVCLGTTTLTLVCFAFAQSVTQLMIFRALDGFFCGTMGTSQAFIADLVPKESRSDALAKSGAAMGLGLVIGPAIGGVLAPIGGFTSVALFGAALTLFNTVLGVVSLPGDLTTQPGVVGQSTEAKPSMSVWSVVLQEKKILIYYACNFLYMLGFGFFMGIFPLFFHDLYGTGASQLGFIFMICGMAMIILQMVATKKVVGLLGEEKTMILGIVSRVVTFSCFVVIHNSWVAYILTPFLICGSAFFLPTVASLTSALAPVEARGSVMGFQNALGSLASLFGPVAAGAMYESNKYQPFVFSAWINVLGTVLAMLTTKPRVVAPIEEVLLKAEEESVVRSPSRKPSRLELLGDSTQLTIPQALSTPETGARKLSLDQP